MIELKNTKIKLIQNKENKSGAFNRMYCFGLQLDGPITRGGYYNRRCCFGFTGRWTYNRGGLMITRCIFGLPVDGSLTGAGAYKP